ncbi:MAG: hypothetical protein WCO84_05140 [bacterium]
MTNIELRKLVTESVKYPGTKQIPKASVCNEGFPGTFNLSFIESEWLKEYGGQYIDFDHDYIVSKIQPCIRYQDWETIKSDPVNRFRYLGVFEMASVTGMVSLVDGSKTDEAVSFSIENFYKFLTETVGLSSEKLRITYCRGGDVSHLTKGKYKFNKEVAEDFYIDEWKRMGIKESQFISDDTRDTLLALRIYGLSTPWGYRNEILYEHQGKLLDIGTFEYCKYRPIFKNDEIVDLEKWEHACVVSAVGIERLLMAINGFAEITDCDHIKPIKEAILLEVKNKDEEQAIVLTEGLRTVHRIMSDCKGYENLSRKRKEKIRKISNGIFDSAKKLGIEINDIFLKKILTLNSKLQSYYPELSDSIELVCQEINESKKRIEQKTDYGRVKK